MPARLRKIDDVNPRVEWPGLERTARHLLDLVERAEDSAPEPAYEEGSIEQGAMRLKYRTRVSFLSDVFPSKGDVGDGEGVSQSALLPLRRGRTQPSSQSGRHRPE